MKITSDYLIIGSGVAGLSLALRAARIGSVTIVTKKETMDASTNYAQGGIASVLDPKDSFELHIKDTLESGAGLSKEQVVRMVVTNAPDMIKELIALGVNFSHNKTQTDKLDLTREGGHSKRRIVHTEDLTGQEVERALIHNVEKNKNIQIYENHMVIDLITTSKLIRRSISTNETKETCWGAYVLDIITGKITTFLANITILATGGAGKVYLYTTNPDIATGDGVAIGYRAGAKVANMEFVQFHPTCLYHAMEKNFLISESVRGEGGRLIDKKGDHFMERYHPLKDLALRDVVARSIDAELKKSGDECVYLDISHRPPDFIKNRFPHIYKRCLELNIDITKEPIPVVPAAHYMCGGILTDKKGRTNITNLYAIGEVAYTGLHGANRLASNSLIEALVFSRFIFENSSKMIIDKKDSQFPTVPLWEKGSATDSDESVVVSHNWDEVRRMMWNYVGIVRTNKRLLRAMRRIEIIQQEIRDYYWDFIITRDLLELRNLATVAELIITSATMRKESRGLHYNLDYPERDEQNWRHDTIM
jgi:L-aspartate oxidase